MCVKIILPLLVPLLWADACRAQKKSTVLSDKSGYYHFCNFDKQEKPRFGDLFRKKWTKRNLETSNSVSDFNGETGLVDWLPEQIPYKLNETSNQAKFWKNNEQIRLKLQFAKVRKNFNPGQKSGDRCFTDARDAKSHKKIYSSNWRSNRFRRASSEDVEEVRKRRKKKKNKHRRWSKWSEWSPCSVTCGKGRQIRYRKCISKTCMTGELEMGEKICQLPACSILNRLFSLFQ